MKMDNDADMDESGILNQTLINEIIEKGFDNLGKDGLLYVPNSKFINKSNRIIASANMSFMD